MNAEREQLWADLSRFFALSNFDAPRNAAIARLRGGQDDIVDRSVLNDRLDAFIRNGYTGARKHATLLKQRINSL